MAETHEAMLLRELRAAYGIADNLGEFVIAFFEAREMGENEAAINAMGRIVAYRRWRKSRMRLPPFL